MTTLASLYGRNLVDLYYKHFSEKYVTPEKVFPLWAGSVERFQRLATDEDVMAAITAELQIRKEGFVTLRG